jgi:3-hydroxyisobutyrate dehydrogenase-like beta-hydroxyacid dehydrogenase
MIGLGRMGGNMVERLMRHGHQCVVFDLSPDNVRKYVEKKATGSSSLADFVQKLNKPRAAWVMVPAGAPTEKTIAELAKHMEYGTFATPFRRIAQIHPHLHLALRAGGRGHLGGIVIDSVESRRLAQPR